MKKIISIMLLGMFVFVSLGIAFAAEQEMEKVMQREPGGQYLLGKGERVVIQKQGETAYIKVYHANSTDVKHPSARIGGVGGAYYPCEIPGESYDEIAGQTKIVK